MFAVDARDLYNNLYEEAAAESDAGTLGWLASAGCLFQDLREENAVRVRWTSRISGTLGGPMVIQTLAWPAGLAITDAMTPPPVPPSEIKTLSTSIGIEERRGGSTPATPPAAPQK